MASLRQVLGESDAIAGVREQVGRLLRSTGGARRLPPILVLGETGTGKGLLAGAIHVAGGRGAGPFVDVNCAAIPEPLLEAELFGFERGAFTDARQAKPGLFQVASGGTLFLDEVGLLPLGLQAKLLKVIEERSVRRLGSTRSEPLDVCVVAATSEDLPLAVQRGRFRADLYHRLAVVTLTLPPLRDRGQDVLLLARYFLGRLCQDYGLPVRVLREDAERALLAHRWPGNVRELSNVLERAVLLADDTTIGAVHLALSAAAVTDRGRAVTSPGPEPLAPGEDLADPDTDAEQRVILEALRATRWNFTRAAAKLGVPRNTLRDRSRRLGLVPEGSPARRRGGRPPGPRQPVALAGPPPPEAPARTSRITYLYARLVAGDAPASAAEMGRALREVEDKVRTFGGAVEVLDLESLLATFGVAPEEDAPGRAAHAALAARRLAARARHEDPRRPDVKLALHTEVLPAAPTAESAALDPAARQGARRVLEGLIEAAEPGTVVATGATGPFLARAFDLAPLHGAQGRATALRVLRHAERGRTRFVGREGELRVLAERFDLARNGKGQVVTVVGEPGIGKSRLLREFQQRLGSAATWVEGQALSFGRSMPFHPVVDMLRRVFRIDEEDPEPRVVEKIEQAVRRLGDDLEHTVPFVRYLLSIDPGDPTVLAMDPRLRHAEILRTSHLLLERAALRRPHVVVLEDVHWCDVATEDWIVRLADGITAKRVLIVVTCRPGHRVPFGGRSFHTSLALSTLSRADTVRMAGSLLGADLIPPELEALVVDKAEGNPFFVEELVQALREVGAVGRRGDSLVLRGDLQEVAVPDTVEEVIRARLDRLENHSKETLEVAAVVGKDFSLRLLQALGGRPSEMLSGDLVRLQEAEFLQEVRVFPEVEYTFKHALTQDVAYGGLAAERRRALHARAVGCIEHLYAGRLAEHVERLAHHALRGEQWERAVEFCRAAFAKAFDRSANREAVASLDQALAALAHLPPTAEHLTVAIDIRLALRSALLQLGQIRRITETLREAEALATRADDRVRLAWVWTYLTICHLFAGDLPEALDVGELALALAEEVGDVGLRMTARTPLAHALLERGDYRRALTLLRETIGALTGDRVRERMGQAMPPALYARNLATMCLAGLGEFAEAVRLATESASLAQALDFPFGLALARIVLGHAQLAQGHPAEAARTLDLALELIEVRGLPTWFPWAAATRGHALARSGRAAEAVPLLEEAIARAEALPFLFAHSQWVTWLAHARLAAGQPDEADRLARQALATSSRRGERGYEAWALHVLGEVEGQREGGAAAEAEALQQRALALAAELEMRPLAAYCHHALGDLARRRGDTAQAREHGAQAAALYAALDMPVSSAPRAP